MIDLDETVEEVHIATCLDRGRIALNQTGQHHCAMVLGKLQEAIDEVAEDFELNHNKPVEIVRWLIAIARDEYPANAGPQPYSERATWFREASR